jgi:hypothetical protein
LPRTLAAACAAGLAMTVAALLAAPLGPWLAAPLAVAVYACAIGMSGEFDRSQLAMLKGLWRRGAA